LILGAIYRIIRRSGIARSFMADKHLKHVGNADGLFYVDKACVDCDLCRQAAPSNFNRNHEVGYSFVTKQPENDKEREDCQRALQDCPVEAIGSDG